MSTQERDIILSRLLAEIEILVSHRNGLTIKEFAQKLREFDRDQEVSERTVRRDCLVFEMKGLVESRGDDESATWRVKASDRLYKWFPKYYA